MSGALACAECPVRARAACAVLNDGERAELAALGRARRLARGEVLSMPGDVSLCATLISGALKIVDSAADGTETIVSLVHPAGFTGELFAPRAGQRIEALTDSHLCVFPQSAYAGLVNRHPALALALLQRAEVEIAEARALMGIGGRRGSVARIAALLLAFARAASDSSCHPAAQFDLPVTRGDMAAMLGLTIETVSRGLGKIERQGAIARSGTRTIAISNLPLLSALSS